MLVVETIAKIGRPHFVDGKSIKQICRELRLSRNVVRAQGHPTIRRANTSITNVTQTVPDQFGTFVVHPEQRSQAAICSC